MRMTSLQSRRRAAFTLIELLVVIAIIAILCAMVAGAIFRMVGSQQLKRTEATVKKTQTGFEGQWKAVIDDAQEDIKNHKVRNVMASFQARGVNDNDTANALYVKMRLKVEFPQSFAEARNPGLAAYGLQAKTVYTQEIGTTAPLVNGTPEQEAAVLLYLALTQTRRGAVINADEFGGAVKTITVGTAPNTKDFKVIVDAWGNPITFQRFGMDAGWVSEMTALSGGRDPFDPYGKLNALSTAAPLAPKTFYQNLLADQFNNQNHGPIIRSAGPDRSFATTTDDVIGFRLMKEGQKGN